MVCLDYQPRVRDGHPRKYQRPWRLAGETPRRKRHGRIRSRQRPSDVAPKTRRSDAAYEETDRSRLRSLRLLQHGSLPRSSPVAASSPQSRVIPRSPASCGLLAAGRLRQVGHVKRRHLQRCGNDCCPGAQTTIQTTVLGLLSNGHA